ncbi:outer membrane beta-barrel protein [Kaarinaea lacus]
MFYQSRKLLTVLSFCIFNAFYISANYASAQEEDGGYTYAGADVNFMNLDALNATYNPINMRAKLGVILLPDLIPVLALETHFGFGLTNDTNTFNGQDIELGVDYYVGIYARASHEVADFVSVYGLLGAAVAQLDGDTLFVKDDTKSSLSYGLGAIFKAPLDIDVSIEVMQLIGSDVYDVYMASLGASYKF